MNILVVDVGGTGVKILATGHEERRKFPSGPTLTAEQMVARVRELAGDWPYDAVSIGYPGFVLRGRPIAEPHNLAPGWVGFDFQAAFDRPVKIIHDAALQALGSYQGGKMLFLGLGTGLGAAMVVDGIVEPMELAAIGKRTGVANILGLNFSGFIAWFLWRTIYLTKLPRLEKKVRVALKWALDLFFSKDIIHFSTARTSAVPHQHAAANGPGAAQAAIQQH
jgi:polyphosphate glucokinase